VHSGAQRRPPFHQHFLIAPVVDAEVAQRSNLQLAKSRAESQSCRSFLPANGPIMIEFLLPQRLGERKFTPNEPGIWEILAASGPKNNVTLLCNPEDKKR
jgi:hypothetical protein